MYLWLTRLLAPFSKLIKRIKRQKTFRRKRATVFKMLPDENIEQIKRPKTEKENRKYYIKTRLSIIGASFGVVIMLFLLLSIWFINDDGKVKWFGGLLKNEASSEFESVASQIGDSENDELLIIVNSSSKLPDDYSPKIKEYKGVEISEKAYNALSKMMSDAVLKGYELEISSGYISPSKQEEIYKSMYDKFIGLGYTPIKAENEASKYKSGFNEQNTGLSVMFYDMTPSQYTWILENCVNYGFIQRYPENKEKHTKVSFEPNLFRFVGEENALNMRKFGMCLEEYSEYLSMR